MFQVRSSRSPVLRDNLKGCYCAVTRSIAHCDPDVKVGYKTYNVASDWILDMPWGRQSRVVSVVLGTFNYGFRTTCRETTSSTLGHVNAMTNSVLATGTVLGCNRPKPGSASKPGATTNGESSF
ncbi:hypothetical protein, partial [Microseira wollei]|uniref:hypothetical protein n=1 Tax=Microseira wollei TaxID=467598 RepID=UPI001CFDDEC3